MRATIAALACSLALLGVGCIESKQQMHSGYTLPQTLRLDYGAERGDHGEIVIRGTTNLPDGMKLGAEIHYGRGKLAQDFKVFIDQGQFRSTGFTQGGDPLPAGKYKVTVLAYFNEAWQSREILRIVGRGGSKLKGEMFKLEDPELIDSAKQLELTRTLLFPPFSGGKADALRAIGMVKRAVLIVDGRRSADNIEDTVAQFMKAPGLRVNKGWDSEHVGGTTYRVTFDFINGQLGPETAIWEVDLVAKKVRYLNKNAKYFSWSPDY